MIHITTGRRIQPVDTISPRTTFVNAGLLGDTRSQDIGDINLTLLQISQTGGVADQREIGIIQTCAVAIAYVTLILFARPSNLHASHRVRRILTILVNDRIAVDITTEGVVLRCILERRLTIYIHYPLVYVSGHVIQSEIVGIEGIYRVGDHILIVQRTADTHHVASSTNEVSLHLPQVALRHIARMIAAPRVNLTLDRQTVITGYRSISSELPLSLGRQTIAVHKDTVGDSHLTGFAIAILSRMTTIIRNVLVIHLIFLGIEYKLIADPLVARTINGNRLVRIFLARLLIRH